MSNKKTLLQMLTLDMVMHSLVSADVDASRANKPEELRIAKKAQLFTIKSVVINQLKGALGAGGAKVVIINGGPEEISLPANAELISTPAEFNFQEKREKSFFANVKAAVEVANTANEGEIIRLKAIAADCLQQVKALEDVNAANKSALSIYKDVENED